MSTKRAIDGSDAYPSAVKRQRAVDSRIVYVRGLPDDCLESELLALCCPFAVVEKSVILPSKTEALVQLPDPTAATNLINFYKGRETMIRGNAISFEMSDRDEITSTSVNAPPPQYQSPQRHQEPPRPAARAPVNAAPLVQQQPPMAARPIVPANPAGAGAPPAQMDQPQFRRGGTGSPNTILMVSVTNIEYEVTADVLRQVFQKFGNVMKIIVFWKNNEFKALVEMESIDQAQAAQGALDGRDIYTGCNTLHIVFSRHSELNVRFNSERSRDYTNPNLPDGPDPSDKVRSRLKQPPSEGPTGLLQHHQQQSELAPPQQSMPPAYLDGPTGYGGGGGNEDRYGPPAEARGGGYTDDYAPPDPYARNLPAHSTGRSVRTDKNRSPVLICSNMDSRLVSPDHLFTFFGCFGDVIRVKIMFRKQDTALIQFADDLHATSALDNLDGVYIFGRKLRVDYSKHINVSMPRGEVDRFELENTRDFSSSPLHRFRHRNPLDAAPPGVLLEVSNVPIELQHNQNALGDLFAQYGFVKDLHLLHKTVAMACLEMGTIDEAVMALLCLDNLAYPDANMRVCFSKGLQHLANAPAPVMPMQMPTMPMQMPMSMPMQMPMPLRGAGPGPGGYPNGGGFPRDRSRDRSRDRGPPAGRDRSRDRSRDRGFRDRDRGRDRRGPPDRGAPYRRGPPPGRY